MIERYFELEKKILVTPNDKYHEEEINAVLDEMDLIWFAVSEIKQITKDRYNKTYGKV